MADPPSPQRNADADRDPTAGTPRWVKVSGIIALVVLLLVLIMLLSGGNHGPGRHRTSGGLGGPWDPAMPQPTIGARPWP